MTSLADLEKKTIALGSTWNLRWADRDALLALVREAFAAGRKARPKKG